MKLTSRSILAALFVGFAASLTAAAKPNLIFILADTPPGYADKDWPRQDKGQAAIGVLR